jgi:hypothetical protein
MPTRNPDTVDSLVAAVNQLLESPEGRRRVESITSHFGRLRRDEGLLKRQVSRLRRRPGAAFYATVGGSRSDRLRIDVRVFGEACGVLTLDATRTRFFVPKNHLKLWQGNPHRLEWADHRVRHYLNSVAATIQAKSREATVESAFLELARRKRGGEAKGSLAGYQPVLLAGLPFQFPLPISARSGVRLTRGSGAAGHMDVVLRGPGGRLMVIEVKKDRASDVEHALAQAVAYCAALRFLLGYSKIYYPTLGYRRTGKPPRMRATVLVHDDPRTQTSVRQAAEGLNADNHYFDLSAFFFCWEQSSNGRQLVVGSEQSLVPRSGRSQHDL